MQTKMFLSFGFVLLMALFGTINADAIFMTCPTVFKDDISSVKANVYIGSPPLADCGGLKAAPIRCNNVTVGSTRLQVLVNGQKTGDLLSCSCDPANIPGLWNITLSTPIKGEYNISTYLLNDGDKITAEYQCIPKRAEFTGSITIPDLPIVLMPLIIFVALFLLRKRKHR